MILEKIAEKTEIAVVLDCGGRGERLGTKGSKVFVDMGNGDKPLFNLLQDIPQEIPVYIHLLNEQINEFRNILSKQNFGHNVSYLIQDTNLLYDEEYKPIIKPDGTWAYAPNGLITFTRHFGKLPKYFLVTGGPKVGICWDDVTKAHKILDEDKEKEVIVFVRDFKKSENDEECQRWLESQHANDLNRHTRYCRINEKRQEVYEHPCMNEKVFSEDDWFNWPVSTGMHLLRAEPYSAITETIIQDLEYIERRFRSQTKENSISELIKNDEKAANILRRIGHALVDSRSTDSEHSGKAFFLRTNMLLNGYNGDFRGLSFRTYKQEEGYCMSVKTPNDLEKYLRLVEEGKLPRRKY